MSRLINLEGKNFGDLKVINRLSNDRNGHARWRCICVCGKSTDVLGTHLVAGNSKSCGCKTPKLGDKHKQWNGVGEISGGFWFDHVVRSAGGKGNRREIEFTITKEYAWNLFLEQGRKCKLTGLQISFPTRYKDKSGTASLDRIDSGKGYVEGNVQWLHKDVNMMKRTYEQAHFIAICKLVANSN